MLRPSLPGIWKHSNRHYDSKEEIIGILIIIIIVIVIITTAI